MRWDKLDKMSEFKNYPEEKPSYNGTNYLTIIEYADTFSYAFTYINKDAEWENIKPEGAKVVAFTETHPCKIMRELGNKA